MIYSSEMNGREGKKTRCFRVRITLQFRYQFFEIIFTSIYQLFFVNFLFALKYIPY